MSNTNDEGGFLKVSLARLAEHILYGGYILSFGGASILATVMLLTGVGLQIQILILSFCTVQIIYSYNHLSEMQDDLESNPERVGFLKRNLLAKKLEFTIYVVSLIALIMISQNYSLLLIVLFILSGGILYTVFIKEKFLSIVPGLKSLYTALFWSLQILIIPMYFKTRVEYEHFIFIIFVFLSLFVNATFFDIKDIEDDLRRNIITLPVKLGKDLTIKVLTFTRIISFLVLIVGIAYLEISMSAIGLLIFLPYTLMYLRIGYRSKDVSEVRFWSYLVVDGEYILWTITILLTSLFLQ